MERMKYTSKFVPCTCIMQLNHTRMILGLNRGLEMLKRQKLVRLHKQIWVTHATHGPKKGCHFWHCTIHLSHQESAKTHVWQSGT